MNLLYISSSTLPSRSANSVHVMKMCEQLSLSGIFFDGVKLMGLEGEGGLDIHDLYGTKKNFTLKLLKFSKNIPDRMEYFLYTILSIKYALKLKPSYVYSRNFLSAVALAFLGFSIVLEVHAPHTKSLKFYLLNMLMKKQQLKSLVVISEALKKIYIDAGIQRNDKILVAHDGATVAESSMPVSINTDRLNVGYTGHLYPGRGIDLIFSLAALCDSVDFHIVGGSESDIKYWKGKCSELTNVYLHGYVDPSLIPNYLASFDILLAPYQRVVQVAGGGNTVDWMSPLKIFEYMASGRPMIASDLPVLREILKPKENALLCKSDDVQEWAEAISLLREDECLGNSIGANAYECLINNYSWSARVNRVLFSLGLIEATL